MQSVSSEPSITNTYDYNGQFVLKRGDLFFCRPRSAYIDNEGIKHIMGVSGKFIFWDVVRDGILARQSGSVTTEFIYMGPERVSPLTGTILKPHVLSIPKKPKVKLTKVQLKSMSELMLKHSKKKPATKKKVKKVKKKK